MSTFDGAKALRKAQRQALELGRDALFAKVYGD